MGFRILILLSLLFSQNTFALTELEKEKLKQALDTLEVAKQIFREAQKESSETDPVRLKYERLLFDIGEVQSAVKRHVVAPSRVPRELKELHLDYK